MNVRPLASQPGLEDNPSISPDGLWVACLYRPRIGDHPLLQVHSIKGGPPVVIDTGQLRVTGPAAWSPDSTELAFDAIQGSQDIYRVSRTGGVPRRVAACTSNLDASCELDWAPDGKTLAVTRPAVAPERSELYLIDLASGRQRDLIPPDEDHLSYPRFSPDGKWIAYAKPASMTTSSLYIVPTAAEQPRQITRASWSLKGLAWSTDGKSLVALASRLDNKTQIWQFPVNGKSPFRVADLDQGRGSDLSLSRGQGSIAWVRDLSANSLWRMPVDPSGPPAEQLSVSAAEESDAEWSSTGRMLFRSYRSGANELWIAKRDGSSPWQATHLGGPFIGDPHWSPDGRAIAFTAHADGKTEIFVMRCATNASSCEDPRALTNRPGGFANPTWSADGNWIYFASPLGFKYDIWRLSAQGNGEPERITWNGGYLARESADGKQLYYSKSVWPLVSFWRISLPARGPGQVETPVALRAPYKAGATWALGKDELYYYPSTADPANQFPAVRAVNLATGRIRDLPVGNTRLGRGLSLSPDGRWLLRSQSDRAQTLVMIAEKAK